MPSESCESWHPQIPSRQQLSPVTAGLRLTAGTAALSVIRGPGQLGTVTVDTSPSRRGGPLRRPPGSPGPAPGGDWGPLMAGCDGHVTVNRTQSRCAGDPRITGHHHCHQPSPGRRPDNHDHPSHHDVLPHQAAAVRLGVGWPGSATVIMMVLSDRARAPASLASPGPGARLGGQAPTRSPGRSESARAESVTVIVRLGGGLPANTIIMIVARSSW